MSDVLCHVAGLDRSCQTGVSDRCVRCHVLDRCIRQLSQAVVSDVWCVKSMCVSLWCKIAMSNRGVR